MAQKTKAEIMKELKELRATAEKLVDQRNELNEDGESEKAREVEIELIETVNKYTSEAKNLAYNECKNSKNPMVAGCKKFNYDTIRVKEIRIEGSTQTTLEIDDAVKPIKLRELHNKCNGIGKDQKWIYAVEKFNQKMTAKVCSMLGIDPTKVYNSYYMSKLAKDVQIDVKALSDESCFEDMNNVVHKMLGDKFNITKEDYNRMFITYASADKVKALKTICSNHEKITRSFQSICNRLITNGQWEVDFREDK